MSTVSIQRASTPNTLTSLYDYMNELHEKIARRAFSFFEGEGWIQGHDIDHWRKAESEYLTPVALELSETDTELLVRAEVPGFSEKDLEIGVEPERLIIKGKVEKKSEQKKKKTIYSEISSQEIFRNINLPSTIDPEKVTAVLTNGVLEISMVKAMPAKKVAVMGKVAA
jgi:HSP20 family molecular chaperone IbpA